MTSKHREKKRQFDTNYKHASRILDDTYCPPGIESGITDHFANLHIIMWRVVECLCGQLVTTCPIQTISATETARDSVYCDDCHRPVEANYESIPVSRQTSPAHLRAAVARLTSINSQDAHDYLSAQRTARFLRPLPKIVALIAFVTCVIYFLFIRETSGHGAYATAIAEGLVIGGIAALIANGVTRFLIDMTPIPDRLLHHEIYLWTPRNEDRYRYVFQYQPRDLVRANAQKMPEGIEPVTEFEW